MTTHKHYLQIDILKALAIIAVLINHSFYKIFPTGNPILIFTIYQAVPIFLIILGINAGMSFKRRNYTFLTQMYSKEYFKARLERLLPAFIVVFLISIILGLLMKKHLYFGILTLIGYLPSGGPGNYFISIVFQFVFIFPIIYYAYRRSPIWTLILSFIISFFFGSFLLILIPLQTFFPLNTYLYLQSSCSFKCLFAFAMGIWVSDYLYNNDLDTLIHKKSIKIGTTASILYLLVVPVFKSLKVLTAVTYKKITPFFVTLTPAVFYPLFLCIMGLKFLPSESDNKTLSLFSLIGRASYHIFLIQIVYFGVGIALMIESLSPKISIILCLMNVIILITIGLIFFKAESKLKNWLKIKVANNQVLI